MYDLERLHEPCGLWLLVLAAQVLTELVKTPKHGCFESDISDRDGFSK